MNPKAKTPSSTKFFFASFIALAFVAYWIACLFAPSETRVLFVVNVGLALLFLWRAADNFRTALVTLAKELEIVRRDCR